MILLRSTLPLVLLGSIRNPNLQAIKDLSPMQQVAKMARKSWMGESTLAIKIVHGKAGSVMPIAKVCYMTLSVLVMC
jgi:hypothetical protein